MTARDQALADLACLFNALLRPVPPREPSPLPQLTRQPNSVLPSSLLQTLPSLAPCVDPSNVVDAKASLEDQAGVRARRARGGPLEAPGARSPVKAHEPRLDLSLYGAAVQALRDAKHFVKDYGGELRPDKLPASCCSGRAGQDLLALDWTCVSNSRLGGNIAVVSLCHGRCSHWWCFMTLGETYFT